MIIRSCSLFSSQRGHPYFSVHTVKISFPPTSLISVLRTVSFVTVTDLSEFSFSFSFLPWIEVLILCFYQKRLPSLPHLPPIFCSWFLPSCLLPKSYTSTLLLSQTYLTFLCHLLLTWMDYRLNHCILFCFYCNAWKFSSTVPTYKGSLVLHSKQSLNRLELLIYGHWLNCCIHRVHTKAAVLISSIYLRSLLIFRPSDINRGKANVGHATKKGKHSPDEELTLASQCMSPYRGSV